MGRPVAFETPTTLLTPAGFDRLDAALVRRLIDYTPETGSLTWKRRTLDLFAPGKSAERACAIWNTRHSGNAAGSLHHSGYVRVCLGYNRYAAHRLIWLYMTGEWPRDLIDHRNGDRSDNRWSNLREATNYQNSQNYAPRKNNPSGYLGVGWDRQRSKWRAQIMVRGKQFPLGRFDNIEAARSAYIAAKSKLHPFNPIPRDGGTLVRGSALL